MTDLIRQLTDDQLALLGCFGTAIAALLLLSISFHANPRNRQGILEENPSTLAEVSRSSEPEEEHRQAA